MKNDRGYTYLITNGREYKIGITTKTPQSRVAELQTGSPTKIAISAYSYNSNALAMEIELHRKFDSKRLEGEWFALNDDDVAIIHHHFENNYLDEYHAPLSERGIEIARLEAEKKRKKDNEQRIRNLELAEEDKELKIKKKYKSAEMYMLKDIKREHVNLNRIYMDYYTDIENWEQKCAEMHDSFHEKTKDTFRVMEVIKLLRSDRIVSDGDIRGEIKNMITNGLVKESGVYLTYPNGLIMKNDSGEPILKGEIK